MPLLVHLSLLGAACAANQQPNPKTKPPTLMINGLSGAMGQAVAKAALSRHLNLLPYALTRDGDADQISIKHPHTDETVSIALVPPTKRDALAQTIAELHPTLGSLICIDYTHPSAVNDNAEWYAANNLPFVMGTTGGDRDALAQTVAAGDGTYCVIAPNMAKQIVAIQAAFSQLAVDFPGAFSGYKLRVVESHQSTKADTSGTAKAISADLARLTAEADFTPEAIERVRDPAEQLAGGGLSHTGVSPVPESAISGHAYHTYSMVSGDGMVEFQLRHNVQGRTTYAEGTVDAAVFLAARIAAGESQRQYTMIDVLRAGGM